MRGYVPLCLECGKPLPIWAWYRYGATVQCDDCGVFGVVLHPPAGPSQWLPAALGLLVAVILVVSAASSYATLLGVHP